MINSLYIDNLVSDASTVEEAFELFQKTRDRLKEGGFVMHKWKSNNVNLLEAIKDKTKGEIKE